MPIVVSTTLYLCAHFISTIFVHILVSTIDMSMAIITIYALIAITIYVPLVVSTMCVLIAVITICVPSIVSFTVKENHARMISVCNIR